MEGKPPDFFRGVPERFQEEGVFGYNRELIRVGDRVFATVNIQDGQILRGTELIIESIIIDPKEDRGFSKRITFIGIPGDYNPKNFKKLP